MPTCLPLLYKLYVAPDLPLPTSQKTFVQLFRSLCASSACFALDMLLLAGLTELAGFHYLVSAAGGFLAGSSLNYLFCSRWIFFHHRLRTRALAYTLFLLAAGGGLALNELAIWLLTDFCALHYLISKIAAGSSIFVLNFLFRKHVLFR